MSTGSAGEVLEEKTVAGVCSCILAMVILAMLMRCSILTPEESIIQLEGPTSTPQSQRCDFYPEDYIFVI